MTKLKYVAAAVVVAGLAAAPASAASMIEYALLTFHWFR
jgi:hypothetical protein